MGLLGSIFGADDARKANQKQVDAQNEQIKRTDKYQNRVRKLQNRYNRKSVKIARDNEKTFREYANKAALQDWTDTLKINAFQYDQQVRQFNESERIYGLQRQFNSQAANLARAAEARRFEEITAGMAFEQQDMLVKMLQEEGNVQATGQAGKSMGKSLGSVLAGYGRNQAIMAESLLSAQRDSRGNYRQIEQDKYGADLNADARRMLQPLRAPDPTKPLELPKAVIQKSLNMPKAPKTVAAINTAPKTKWYDYVDVGIQVASMFI